jgi:hypothetical protein
MFQEKGVVFGGGISSARIEIFAKFWRSNGGTVHIRKKPTTRTTALSPMSPESIHLIVIENKKIRLHDLEKQLHCSTIPEEIAIVHSSWIERCAQYKEYVEIEPFLIQLTAAEAAGGGGATAVVTLPRAPDESDRINKKRSLGMDIIYLVLSAQCQEMEERSKPKERVTTTKRRRRNGPKGKEFAR